MRICLVTSIVVEHKTENKTEAWQHIPTGLLSLAAVLENKGHEVSVVDFNLLINTGEIKYDAEFYDNAAKYLKNYNAEVLGFSTVCDSYPHTIQIAQRYKDLCKDKDKNAIIVLGGPQASAVDLDTLTNFQFIDLIVRGEGELTFAEVIEKLETGETFADIRGITYTYRENGSTKIKRNPDRELIQDLDTLPIPAYHIYPITESGNYDYEEIPLDIGRGCPYDCIYCSTAQFWKRKYRLKSIDRILKEIEFLNAKYSVREFTLTHDLFTANKKRLVEFCNALIERGLDIKWRCYGRIDIMDSVLLEKMAEAGCIGIFYGIESGSAKMQRYIGKNLDLSEVLPVIKGTVKNGITVATSFIIGFPEETEEDLRQTIDLFLDCFQSGVEQSSLFLLVPLPGTRVYQENKDNLIFYDLTYFGGLRIGEDENLEIVRKYPSVFPSFYFIKPRYLDLKMLALVQDALNNSPISLIAIKNELGDSLKIFKFKFENWNSCTCTEEKSFYRYIRELLSEGKLKTAYLKDLLEYENTFCLLAKEKFEGKQKSKSNFEFENKVEINGKVEIKEFDYDIKEIINSLKQKHFSMQIKIKKELCIIMFYKKGYMSVKTSRINNFTKELIELCNKNRNYSVGDVVNEMVARSYNKGKCVEALKELYEMAIISLN